ncbi:MAG: phosphate-starvation-inducible PsiE family protein [Steroidobacteraceae bacterium]
MRLQWFESTMDVANRLLHVFMALALLIASVLLICQFVADVTQTVRSGQLAQGFLQALGNLFILWVLSSLISAEVRYMHSGRFSVLVFIEAALITLLRQLIIIPEESAGHLESAAWTYGLITTAVVAVGLTYYLVQRTSASSSDDGSPDQVPPR